MRASQTSGIPASGSALQGDVTPLMRQLAADETLPELGEVASTFQRGEIKTVEDLRQYALDYQDRVLHPVELPAVLRAWQYARQGGARELAQLDQELSRQPVLHSLAASSQRMGRIHLKRLRPLRDQRVVQRYLAAIERGEARGWHMIVFGLILSVYSIPLYQGLIYYGRASIHGLLAGDSNLGVGTENTRAGLENEILMHLPGAARGTIALNGAEDRFFASQLLK